MFDTEPWILRLASRHETDWSHDWHAPKHPNHCSGQRRQNTKESFPPFLIDLISASENLGECILHSFFCKPVTIISWLLNNIGVGWDRLGL